MLWHICIKDSGNKELEVERVSSTDQHPRPLIPVLSGYQRLASERFSLFSTWIHIYDGLGVTS